MLVDNGGVEEHNEAVDNGGLDEEEDIAIVNSHIVRKNILPTLNNTINKNDYDALSQQASQTFEYVSSGKQTKVS